MIMDELSSGEIAAIIAVVGMVLIQAFKDRD
jgi:hypothetical protein